ncbi:DUF3105 domain-containing protein [Candidatus Solirubrobacter pratensis]|uniref:DUF3105 domain-containing protein n=1 Tax=Candidatus Solirubrobacter pratensis TaxID=1298857 RepID=UPI00041E6E8A|nr:DUF3105 domain-containing protein [Candidatus Solirubrobacter pratensis]
MSSRQEEKERRRREREEREQAERATQSRRKRLQYVFGGLLSVLVIAGVAALAAGAFTGGGSGSPSDPPTGGADIPGVKETDLKKAAAAASCELKDAPIEGNTHEDKAFKPSDYKTNPPTSGNHNPTWYQDGEYNPGDTPRLGMLVHPLEHGRIELQYKKGSSDQTVKQLRTLFNQSSSGYHMLLFENTTNMPYAVAATAWGHLVGCTTMNPKVFDALRAFRESYIDKGPEIVP